jgi:hypothetical protein
MGCEESHTSLFSKSITVPTDEAQLSRLDQGSDTELGYF